MTLEWSTFKIKPGDPIVFSPLVRQLLQNLPKVVRVEISKAEWDKLSSAAKEMVKNKQVTWITTA